MNETRVWWPCIDDGQPCNHTECQLDWEATQAQPSDPYEEYWGGLSEADRAIEREMLDRHEGSGT